MVKLEVDCETSSPRGWHVVDHSVRSVSTCGLLDGPSGETICHRCHRGMAVRRCVFARVYAGCTTW